MFLGFDTSNYTTSLALYDGENIVQKKKVLSVKQGERGLRQSDALFQHTVNMPKLIDDVEVNSKILAVGVSTRPRNVEGSYMPCFLAGVNTATAVSKFLGVPLFKTSHQVGHILSALYSANELGLVNEKFIAFHLSGGTTEALLVTPSDDEIIKCEIIAATLDLNAGQAVDRTGVMLGLKFPCGKELENLARESEREFKIHTSFKGVNPSLSGVENKATAMLKNGEKPCDIAKFTLDFITKTVLEMCEKLTAEYGPLPLLFSGGVSSNTILKSAVQRGFNAHFATPEFACDNAAGTAIFAKMKLG